jgi:hypothetical protein
MFTAEKREWCGDPSPIALSWFLAVNRHDFTFRTKIFHGFPPRALHADPVRMQIGRFYKLDCRIYKNYAEYYVDGVKYVSCKLEDGEVPEEGYFCMGNYGDKCCDFRNIKASVAPPLS